MAQITGSNTVAGIKLGSTFGTAVSLGTNDQLQASISANKNVETLSHNPIGSGLRVQNDVQVGAIAPTARLECDCKFTGPEWIAVAELFGGASYAGAAHSILVNETAFQKFYTLAWQLCGGSVAEMASCYTTAVEFTFNAPDYVKLGLDVISNNLIVTGTTNSFATLDSAVTAQGTEFAVFDLDDSFRINPQNQAALNSTDKVNITSATIRYEQPGECTREVKESAGLGEPVATDLMKCTLTVTSRKLDDTWYRFLYYHASGQLWKASLTVTGAAAATAFMGFYFTNLKLVQFPDLNATDLGNNPVTCVFEGMVAATAPTGMLDKYPYIILKNARTSSLLA